MHPHLHHFISFGFIGQAVAAMAGLLPDISTVLGVVWFLLVFPATIEDFVKWVRAHRSHNPVDKKVAEATLAAEIASLRAQIAAWQILQPRK